MKADRFTKTLHLKQDESGQWMYQITLGETVVVKWQYGPFDKQECIDQARSRFGTNMVLAGTVE